MPLTQDRVHELLVYEPATGHLRWRTAAPTRQYLIGKIAGSKDCRRGGRGASIKIMIDRKMYPAHRVIWLYVYGYLPLDFIDHINGDPFDNRLANLREATPLQNQANKRLSKLPKSGFIGVFRNECDRTWKARIRKQGRIVYLGSFETASAASEAYLAAHRALHKEFSGISLKEVLGSNRANGLPSI